MKSCFGPVICSPQVSDLLNCLVFAFLTDEGVTFICMYVHLVVIREKGHPTALHLTLMYPITFSDYKVRLWKTKPNFKFCNFFCRLTFDIGP